MAGHDTSPEPAEGERLEGRPSPQKMSLEKPLGVSDTGGGLEPSLETYAVIMATNKPDPRGPGYIKLYLLAGTIFLCSTMNGEYKVPNAAFQILNYPLTLTQVSTAP
jgi:hypothetical protein